MSDITCEIVCYATGKVIGEAKVDIEVYADYELKKIGQWPEGIIPACELLSVPEIQRLRINSDKLIFIEV